MNGKFPPVVKLAKLTYSKFFVKKNSITVTKSNDIDLTQPPYLLLSNHCGVYDPVIISSVMPVHIRWVTGAYLFKSKLLKFVFSNICKCIPKQQGRGDFSAMREIQRSLKSGDVVGLFPEGTRTWDGDMCYINYKSLAKMIRMFKVPVLFVNLQGCYAQQPRWADSYRKGAINVNCRYMLSVEEIESLKLDELEKVVENHLTFSNDAWKETVDYNFVCDKRAEGIQRLLYMCPNCHRIESMESNGNTVACKHCHAKAEITPKDTIKSKLIKFHNISDWHKWEAKSLYEVDSFEEEDGVLLQIGDLDNTKELQTISEKIRVSMKDKTITVKTDSNQTFNLNYDKMSSCILNAKQTMEIICEEKVYRIRLLPDASSLKYQEHYNNYRRIQEN